MVRRAVDAELAPGQLFSFGRPRRIPLLPTALALGQVIGQEAEVAVLHVRTFLPSSERDDLPRIDIAHLPINRSPLLRSITQLFQIGRIEADAWGSIYEWRRRWSINEVGAFSISLWDARRTAWECVPAQQRSEHIYLAYAFPKRRGSEATMTAVEVATIVREVDRSRR